MFGPADKKLGFGFMRLPIKGEEVDVETASRMVDAFLAAGFCYFDTAHGYHDGQSEAALKAVALPAAEVHITDINQREEFRKVSYAGMACQAHFIGQGLAGYLNAVRWLAEQDKH